MSYPIFNFAKATDLVCEFTNSAHQNYADSAGGPSLEGISAWGSTNNLATVASIINFGEFSNNSEICTANILKSTLGEAITLDPSCNLDSESLEERCGNIGLGYDKSSTTYNNSSKLSKNGSLVGIAFTLERATKEPVPLSFAYYFKQNAQKIPFIKNTAYAQGIDTVYKGPLLSTVYNYWEVARNFSYAFMAIVMMIIGILIITQKKVDAKTAVTVQQALPQVIIALFLITFSYPIGATGASLGYGLLNSAGVWAKDLLNLQPLSASDLSSIGLWAFLNSLGSGIVSGFFGFISSIISTIYSILVLFRILGIYLRMLLSIIVSPIIFSIGALPGQQSNTAKWFKQFGAYIISLPATILGFELVKQIGYDVTKVMLTEWDTTVQSQYGGFLLGALTVVVSPLVTISGMQVVMKIPSKIDEYFGLGGKK